MVFYDLIICNFNVEEKIGNGKLHKKKKTNFDDTKHFSFFSAYQNLFLIFCICYTET